ncbi:hypothetical protein J7M00_05735 [bacterium]|nr:hypothetical protein [bacterium]
MAEIENSIKEATYEFEKKLKEGVLPPDPARIIKEILEIPAEIEHATPLPPLIEKVHKELGEPLIEKLPRLPMTRDFGKF